MSDSDCANDASDFVPIQLASHFFKCTVSLVEPTIVLKQGASVRPREVAAMRLVQQHLPHIPVPRIDGVGYTYEDGVVVSGKLWMDYIPGQTLTSMWPQLDEKGKDQICQDIWDLVAQLRTIPRPPELAVGHYRTVDGSEFRDPLLGGDYNKSPTTLDDEALRNLIYTRYVATNGLSYKDGKDVPALLPRSNTSVFTHGDLSPRNIIVDDNCHILGVLDGEFAGWFPDYWEYARMMKYGPPAEYEYQAWMTKTRPQPWDITGIQKARRVLF